jgi:hypothetical protein
MAGPLDTEGSGDGARPESPGLVSDCRLMLSFARKNGFVLPAQLLHQIAWLDSVLKALGIGTVSQMAPQLIWPIDLSHGQPLYMPDGKPAEGEAAAGPAAAPTAGTSPEEVILDTHSRLSVLIAPTTALSLQTSEPPAGQRHIFGGMPPLVQYVIGVAFVSAICFAVSASRIASSRASKQAVGAGAIPTSAAIAARAPLPQPQLQPQATPPAAPLRDAAASATNAGSPAPRRAAPTASEGVKP